jgi:hypothetical protein
VVTQALGYQSAHSSSFEWRANLTIPARFDMQGKSEVQVLVEWDFETVDNSHYSPSLMATVISTDSGSGDDGQTDIMEIAPFNTVKIKVPFKVGPLDTCRFDLYYQNDLVGTSPYASAVIEGSATRLTFGCRVAEPFVEPLNVILTLGLSGATRQLNLRLFSLSPSMLDAMSGLSQSINKANQIEAIQSLQYRQCDLLEAMRRGLDQFNAFGPTLTAFNGTNMQGPIREAWILFSTIAALRAQSLAESMFAFDFSGQAISLTVDRAQAVETALGHYEQIRDNEMKKFKMLLGRKGVTRGSGHQGYDLTRYAQMGTCMISNTPITRRRAMGGGSGGLGQGSVGCLLNWW